MQLLIKEERDLIDAGESLISAIKEYRERTGASLSDAKREVDRYRDNPGAYELEVEKASGQEEKIQKAVQQIGDIAEIYEAVNAPLLRKRAPTFNSRYELTENHRIFRGKVAAILAGLLEH
jgi:hypothetical protein